MTTTGTAGRARDAAKWLRRVEADAWAEVVETALLAERAEVLEQAALACEAQAAGETLGVCEAALREAAAAVRTLGDE